MNKKTTTILATVFLLIAGAITLLFTTKKGSKIRKSAKEKGRKIVDDLKNKTC